MAINYDISRDKYFVSKVEDCCYKLRDAMIDVSLKFPEISTFEHYLKEIKDYDDIVYILGLLHKCWCFAHPDFLFNAVPKNLSADEILQKLSVYQSDSPRGKSNILKEELDKKHNHLLIAYYRAYQEAGKMTLCYGEYMDRLYKIVSDLICRSGIEINNNFTFIPGIKTDKTPEQLERVFYVFSRQFNCCDDSEHNLRIFISMFNTSISAPNGAIDWHDIGSGKNKSPSIAAIYTIFNAIDVEMNLHNKTIICKYFKWPNGKLTPDQIKSRVNDKQSALEKAKKNVL